MGGRLGGGDGIRVLQEARRVDPRKASGRGCFRITFDAHELAGDEDSWLIFELQARLEQCRRIHKGVAVDASVAQELDVRQAGNHAKDALLRAIREFCLKADEVIASTVSVLHSKLHHGVGTCLCFRICEPDRFKRWITTGSPTVSVPVPRR